MRPAFQSPSVCGTPDRFRTSCRLHNACSATSYCLPRAPRSLPKCGRISIVNVFPLHSLLKYAPLITLCDSWSTVFPELWWPQIGIPGAKPPKTSAYFGPPPKSHRQQKFPQTAGCCGVFDVGLAHNLWDPRGKYTLQAIVEGRTVGHGWKQTGCDYLRRKERKANGPILF